MLKIASLMFIHAVMSLECARIKSYSCSVVLYLAQLGVPQLYT